MRIPFLSGVNSGVVKHCTFELLRTAIFTLHDFSQYQKCAVKASCQVNKLRNDDLIFPKSIFSYSHLEKVLRIHTTAVMHIVDFGEGDTRFECENE